MLRMRTEQPCNQNVALKMLLISGSCQQKSQMKLDLNRGFHIHRFTLQYIGPVFPFLNCINCCLNQNGIALHNLEVCQVSLSINCGLQDHITLNSLLLGFSWIVRLHIVNLEAIRDT